MNLFDYSKSATAAAVCLTCLIASGCNSTPEKPTVPSSPATVHCMPPQGHNLNQAMAQAKRSLAESDCRYRFSDIERGLMQVAAGAPGEKNRQVFHAFYRWAADQGVVSELQAKRHYTRYFTVSYAASVPNDINTCDMARNKKDVLDRLAGEVGMKKLGLMQVSGDQDAWFRAKQGHDDLVFLLEGTLDACVAAR